MKRNIPFRTLSASMALVRSALAVGGVVAERFDLQSAPEVVRRGNVLALAEALAIELADPLADAEAAAMLLETTNTLSSSRERRRFAGIIQRSLTRARCAIDDLQGMGLGIDADDRPPVPMSQVLGDVLARIGTSPI